MGVSTQTYLFHCKVRLHAAVVILLGAEVLQIPCMHS